MSPPAPAIALVALHAGYSHSSLALRYLAAYCREEPFGGAIRCHEGLVRSTQAELLASLVLEAPAVVGFSTYLWNIRESLALARKLRRLLPGARVVLGGPEAGPRGEEILDAEAAVDFVIAGEGEEPFRALLRHLLYGEGDPAGIAGLVWREAPGRVRANPALPLDPARWPSPYGHGLGVPDRPLVYWETARGCPYTCSFCTSCGERLRTLPPARVDEDLAILGRLEHRTVKVLDRSFHLGAERTLALLRRFLETPATLRFHLELNPDRISAEALELFAEAPAGKFQFEIGLQSLSPTVLRGIDRKMDVGLALANIERLIALRKHPVHLDLIVGLPDEDAAACRANLDRVFALYPDHLQLGTLKLLPGTPLRARAARWAYLFDDEPPYEVLAHRALAFEELMRFKRYAELLERLWNSGLMVHTLTWLVERHHGGRVSALLDHLLGGPAARLARERAQPDTAFCLLAEALGDVLAGDPVLAELQLWDYAQHGRVNGRTPGWIRARLGAAERLVRAHGNRRMPVLELSAPALEVVNRRRPVALPRRPLAVWPARDGKGSPAAIVALD